ncbi:glycosyltransferase family 2 protein [Streptomyces zingiberis]|uniref:Glycosyltransferase family 2 protein n=1 Tax=Streptomyces zingiberis TaxID=2053010 RepID=A0ABX1C0Y8_9ACTN|nr:glycosyltransferase family 2 protein [Streptomyces zingiberis]NJQ03585.1 glycosyltransferase family 2 protein [Streptomyces zingiberis]
MSETAGTARVARTERTAQTERTERTAGAAGAAGAEATSGPEEVTPGTADMTGTADTAPPAGASPEARAAERPDGSAISGRDTGPGAAPTPEEDGTTAPAPAPPPDAAAKANANANTTTTTTTATRAAPPPSTAGSPLPQAPPEALPTQPPADPALADPAPADPAPARPAPADPGPAPRPARRLAALRPGRASLAVAAGYLLVSVLLYAGLWADPGRRYLVDSMRDQNQWEWFFAITAHHVLNGENPLFTTVQNVPLGVNLMANTAMFGLSVPLAPLTAALGPTVSLGAVLTVGLAATATAWYRLIRCHLTGDRAAAVLGGAVAAFAPPMVSHGNGHPNLAVLFVIPLIIDRALRLTTGRRVVRDGVVLGLLTAWQVFLGEEALLLAASGMLVFALVYACVRPGVARRAAGPLLRGLAIGAAVCLPLVAYPLYWQFFGEQSYGAIAHGPTGNPLRALTAFSDHSLAGDTPTADALSLNPTERNAFYGWPLLLLATVATVRLWRRPAVKALAATGLVGAVLSLGPDVSLSGAEGATTVPGPWRFLDGLPLFESVIESRYAMLCGPVIGMVLALAWAAVARRAGHARRSAPLPADRDRRHRALLIRVAGAVLIGAALLPAAPAPLETVDRPPVPTLVANGNWRVYVEPGSSLVPVPLPSPGEADPLHWQIAADFAFPMPGGYFVGPAGPALPGEPAPPGIYGAVPRPTAELLREVRYSGEVPGIGPEQRLAAAEDLAYWRAGALVLQRQPNDGALRATVELLLGEKPQRVGDAWVWDVG